MNNIIFLVILLTSFAKAYAQSGLDTVINLQSPSGLINGKLLVKQGQLQYAVGLGKVPIIGNSQLGIEVNGKAYGMHVTAIVPKPGLKYPNQLPGKYHLYAFRVYEAAASFQVEFYVSDGGLAFRYISMMLTSIKLRKS